MDSYYRPLFLLSYTHIEELQYDPPWICWRFFTLQIGPVAALVTLSHPTYEFVGLNFNPKNNWESWGVACSC